MKRRPSRAIVVAVLLAAAVAFVSLDMTFTWSSRLIASLDAAIRVHEVIGALLFLVFSALSAMVAFFSTALVVPVAIGAWGKLLTVTLLWTGWLLGGSCSYAIARFLGRPVVRWFMKEEKIRPYEEWLRGKLSFRHILLFQFALPSEIPGYVLGLARYRFATYIAALMIAELPFAIGAVYLGEGFLRRDIATMIAIGVAGLLLMAVAGWFFRSVRQRGVDHPIEM